MVVYGVASILTPIVFALLTWAIFGTRAFLVVGFAAAVG